jgi:anti-sigma factor RsiW
MNSIEEQLWSYIDGTCTAEERGQISHQIAHNPEYQELYQELMQLHNEFQTLELDEPPMAFTYNVMEQIRTQEASVPLKAAINKRIIWGIAAFFVLTILAVLIVALRDMNWSSNTTTATVTMPAQLNVAKVNSFFSGPWMKGFLFFDVVLGLFLFDGYLRKRNDFKENQAQ